MNARPSTLLALLLAACGAPPEPAPTLPDGEGRGLLRVDAAPPAGAVVFTRPTWRVGDRFVLVRGERLRGEFAVAAAGAEGYTIDLGDGRVLRRDLDLGNLGEWTRDDGAPLRVMSPVDVRYHWPLWVGKRWECEFVDRVPGGQPMPMRAGYVVEGFDRISVPAGDYEALRIVRTLRVAAPGEWLVRTQIVWYAPEPGLEVRQVLGDTLVELVEHVRG